jgi:O-antigen ligase
MQLGATWELRNPGEMLDALFFAIGLATIFSVGLQLKQWLHVDGLDLLDMGGGGNRPHANLGQPNQLGTLLLWGLLSAAWAWQRGYIGSKIALVMAMYTLFGLALTASRTAWVGFTIVVGAGWVWRKIWASQRTPWVLTALWLYLATCIWFLIAYAPNLIFQQKSQAAVPLQHFSGTARSAIWQLMADAIIREPWQGYGWNQTAAAQMAVATNHQQIDGSVFTFSHNLFVDLVVWCGLPIGLFLGYCLVRWFWQLLTKVSKAEDVVLVLLVVVIANHAMLELPLYYAYFLLPTGLIVGALNARLSKGAIGTNSRWPWVIVCLTAITVLVLIISDYMEASLQFRNLRFQQMRIRVEKLPAPNMILLTQLEDQLVFARSEPRPGISAEELKKMEEIVRVFPSALFAHKLASFMALNNRPTDARLWLKNLCKFSSISQCDLAKRIWLRQSETHPQIATIPFPVN